MVSIRFLRIKYFFRTKDLNKELDDYFDNDVVNYKHKWLIMGLNETYDDKLLFAINSSIKH
jgi:hypothetical protein